MFFSKRYKSAIQTLKNFTTSSLQQSIKIDLTEEEIDRLARKRQFKGLFFGYNPYQESQFKTLTVRKHW